MSHDQSDLKLHEHVFERGRAPRTLLLLHGTGANERDLLALGRSIDPGANLLSPRGNISENGALRFFKRLGEGVFDLDDVRLRARELNLWITAAIAAYDLAPAQLTALGYSNGANVFAALMLLEPTQVKHAVLYRAMITLLPAQITPLAGTRILMLNGENDAIIPSANAEKLAQTLRTAGAEVTQTMMPTTHALTTADVKLTRNWLNQRQSPSNPAAPDSGRP